MTIHGSLKGFSRAFLASAFALSAYAAQTDISTEPLNTYSAPSSTDVKPNVLFVLDDSGSMSSTDMPDQVGSYSSTAYLFKNNAFNGVAYNPAITYKQPANYNADGSLDTTTYPSMTGASAATGADSSAKPNWNAVPADGYGVQSTGTSNLTNNAYAYVVVPGEYCTAANLRTCSTASAPSATYSYPARLRWCNSSALTACRATYDSSTYSYPRMPSPRTATITVSGSSETSVSHITVGGQEILSATTGLSTSSSTVATNIKNAINNCTNSISGQCTTVGYSASVSGSVVTIFAPGVVSSQPLVTKGNAGTMTFTATSFGQGAVPGENLRTTITSSVTSYSYPGTAAKASTRTDCAASTCTYAEEMTNYANWYAYYRTRMQMMKTATSLAFSTIDSATDLASNVSRFRVGYLSINNATTNDFLNLAEFKTSHKHDWFIKLFSAIPSGMTPLRRALSTAGRLYAGKLNGETLNGSVVTDPLQYSCQQNYSILSTDGYWNSNGGVKLDGSTTMDNQDAASPPPYNDGGSATLQSGTSSLQSQTAQLQTSTSTLQTRTSDVRSSTSTLQESTATLLSELGTLRGTVSGVLMKCNGTTAACGTAPATGVPNANWSVVTSCNRGSSGSAPRCAVVTPSPTLVRNVSSSCDTSISGDTSNPYNWGSTDGGYTYSSCSYSWSAATPAASCTYNVDSSPNNSTTVNATRCSYTAWSSAAPAASCTYQNKTTSTSSGTAYQAAPRQCSYSTWTTPTAAASCTAVNQTSSTTNGTVYTAAPVACSYSAWTAWADATSACTALAQSTSGVYVPTARQCQYTTSSSPTPVASCTTVPPSASSPYTQLVATNCSYSAYTTWASTPTCTAVAKSTSSPYTVGTATNCQYTAWSGWTTVASCTEVDQSPGPEYDVATATKCQSVSSGGTSNTLADVAAYYYGKDLRDATATGADATGTCTGPIIAPATTANDLCADNVPPNGLDVAQSQHMTTFTLGLGAQGQMVYSATYPGDQSGDYYDIRVGTTAAPASGICSWVSAGQTCTWPVPASGSMNNIDDLWHTAVNGRGTYFSATDPESLSSGLSSTLATIINTPRPGTAAAAASSNPNISTSDNYVFSSSYKSVDWYGELIRQQVDHTGNLSPQQWSAMTLLDCGTTVWTATTGYTAGNVFRNGSTCYTVTTDYTSGASFGSADTSNTTVVYGAQPWQATASYPAGSVFRNGSSCYAVTTDYASGASFGGVDAGNTTLSGDTRCDPIVPQTTRTIYTNGGGTLIPFQWANLVAALKDSYFKAPALTYVSAGVGLSQFCSSGATCLSAAQQSNNTIATGGAAGEALVNFLRGDRSNEGTLYRQRAHVMGDIVSSEGRYVKVPLFSYTDTNYSAFKALKSSRAGTVYVAANDGMLHAFDAETGQERWAYVPSYVLPNLYKLADKNYKTLHQYFVDSSPETGDICPNAPSAACASTEWKTILVGGLNRGGKGYFAIDITNPASPSLLWEFTDANLGYSYSNPKITKLKDGTWVVLFASGYNNADGLGRLYVVNANTGALIRSISTGQGSAASPSGLARIAAHSTTATTDNTTRAVYGGDLLGNLWRFDINNDIAPAGFEAQLLVSLKDSSGNIQPITAKPIIATVSGKPVVFVGTGRFLGVTDVADTHVQTFYAVKDNSDTTTFGNPHTISSGFVQQTLTSGTCPATAPTTVCVPGQAVRTGSSNAVDWSSKNGWYVDFLTGGERATTDPTLALGTLLFTTIYPNNSSASACGTETGDSSASYVYALDYRTGAPIANTAGVVGVSLGNVIATRVVVIRLSDGSLRGLIRTSGGSDSGGGTDLGGTEVIDPTVASLGGSTRRVSWRELVTEQ